MKGVLPISIAGACLIYVAAAAGPPRRSTAGFDVAAFGALPVQMDGRVQPIESVARLALLQIRRSAVVPGDREEMQAAEWLLELGARPDRADARRIFRVDDPQLVSVLALEPSATPFTYYAFGEVKPKLADIRTHANRIARLPRSQRAPWEEELLRLRQTLKLYERLKNSMQPNGLLQRSGLDPVRFDFAGRLASFQQDLRAGVDAAAARKRGEDEPTDEAVLQRIREFVAPHVTIERAAPLALVPPPRSGGAWRTVSGSIVESVRTGHLTPPVSRYAALMAAAARNDTAEFNRLVHEYEAWLESQGFGAELVRVRSETFFRRLQPFVRSTALYLLALLLVLVAAITRSPSVLHGAVAAGACAAALHGVGLVLEMTLDRRLASAPLYGLVLTFGFGAAVLGLVAGAWRRSAAVAALGTLAGLGAMAASHSFARGGMTGLASAVLAETGFRWVLVVVAVMVPLIAPRVCLRRFSGKPWWGLGDRPVTNLTRKSILFTHLRFIRRKGGWTMSSFRRIGLALAFAVALGFSGSVVAAQGPVAPVPSVVCQRLAAGIEALTQLTALYPSNPAFPMLLEAATAAYAANCQ